MRQAAAVWIFDGEFSRNGCDVSGSRSRHPSAQPRGPWRRLDRADPGQDPARADGRRRARSGGTQSRGHRALARTHRRFSRGRAEHVGGACRAGPRVRLPAGMSWLLWPASLVFEVIVRLRGWCYRRGVFKQRRLRGVVISVGNLTVGGTGKTPMVLWIAERLIAEGKPVGILTRGYRGGRPAGGGGKLGGDEGALLRERLRRKARFGIGADRYRKGLMLERHGVEWFVLDDGFQHLRLARDADIVLIDATDPFGGGFLLPAGRLREPKSSLSRADIVVVTRSEQDRKSTRLNSSHLVISYAVFCLKKKKRPKRM